MRADSAEKLVELTPLRPGRLLIVHNQNASIEHLSKVLTEDSHQIEVSTSHIGARRLLEDSQKAIEVCLIHFAFLEQEKNKEQLIKALMRFEQRVKFLIFGDHPNAELVAESFRLGATDFIVAPYHPERLKLAVRYALELNLIGHLEEIHHDADLTRALRILASCRESEHVKRISAQVIRSVFNEAAVATFDFDTQGRKQGVFLPMASCEVSREQQLKAADFLTWLYKKSWRRFRKTSQLRGQYAPWHLKKFFGRINLLIPFRHTGGLCGTALATRVDSQKSFQIKERKRASLVSSYIARTLYILEHYEMGFRQSFRDSVTDCYNERFFHYFSEHEFLKYLEEGDPFSVVVVNVHSFKTINEQFGHLVGGQVLASLAYEIRAVLRHEDRLLRLEKDWFLILCPRCDETTAQKFVEALHHQLENFQFQWQEVGPVAIHAEITTASYPEGGQSLIELVNTSRDRQAMAKHENRSLDKTQ